MKQVTLTILVALFSLSAQAQFGSAKGISCSKGEGDAYKNISVYKSGQVVVTFYEAHLMFAKKDVTTIKSNTKEVSPTELYVSTNKNIKTMVEGTEGTALGTVIFVYNPTQKAGRLTVLSDNYTNLRNELFDNCSDEITE